MIPRTGLTKEEKNHHWKQCNQCNHSPPNESKIVSSRAPSWKAEVTLTEESNVSSCTIKSGLSHVSISRVLFCPIKFNNYCNNLHLIILWWGYDLATSFAFIGFKDTSCQDYWLVQELTLNLQDRSNLKVSKSKKNQSPAYIYRNTHTPYP